MKHRDAIIDRFHVALQTRSELDEDIAQADLVERARDVAIALESAMNRTYGPASKDYGQKARTLLFNLNDKENVALRLKLMAGAITALDAVKMDPKELASERLQKERQDAEKANLDARRTDWA